MSIHDGESTNKLMARKLNSEEQKEFIEELTTPPDETWSLKLAQKRDKPLNLTPELEEWFNREFPSEFGF